MNIFKKGKKEDKPADKAGEVKTGKKLGVPPLKTEVGKKKTEQLTGVPPLKATAEKKAVPAKKKERKSMPRAHQILIKPLVTEKATNLGTENKYVFAVARNTNKIEINKAIQELYGVTPVAVNIINLGGKKVRYGRVEGKTKKWKKAVITLREGETIKVFEGV